MIALAILGWLLGSTIATISFCAFFGAGSRAADQDRFENHHHNGSVY